MELNLEPPAESERQMLLLSIYMWGGGNRRGPNIDAEPFQTGFERSLNGEFVRAALASDASSGV